jgi:putative endonuclease
MVVCGMANISSKTHNAHNDNQGFGDLGESMGASYLERKGYRILTRNFKRKTGEIDIVAEDAAGMTLVFVEVKARHSLKYGRPSEAVDVRKMKHIKKTASLYLISGVGAERLYMYSGIRFDVIEILVLGDDIQIVHIEDAF